MGSWKKIKSSTENFLKTEFSEFSKKSQDLFSQIY